MWLLCTSLLAAVLATALPAQIANTSDFSAISDRRARVEAVRAACKQLAGRTDPAAIAQWDRILTEMNLSHDSELKGVVQGLRAMNRYDNASWINLVNMGYVYLGDSESARQFRSELARERPDSTWAVQAAIQQWEATHQPPNTTQAGFIAWGIARVEFLKWLHEKKPHSEAATSEYLNAALVYESRLPTDEALAVADLALRATASAGFLPFDPHFEVAELYLHHHARLGEVPGLLSEAVQKVERDNHDLLTSEQGAERANQQIAWAQLRADSDLAEYWLQKNDTQQAGIAARRAGADLARLTPAANAQHNQRVFYQTEEKRWSKLAERVGIEAALLFQPQQVDWAKVARIPLSDFQATDLTGRRWTLQDWKGKVVLVNMWATWCTPCRAELPYIQKLHEAFRGRLDRIVISIDVDSDAELARRLVREHGYTFPVLNSRRLADHINFENGVPQNRIVDAQGRLLVEPVEGTGDAWVGMVKALMDEVK